jgi:hypothetical protein
LAARARAAAAAEEAAKRYAEERAQDRDKQVLDEMGREAAREASEILGLPVSSRQWRAESEPAGYGRDRVRLATLVEGVRLVTTSWITRSVGSPTVRVLVEVGGKGGKQEWLSLASFGRALEALEVERAVQRELAAGNVQRAIELARRAAARPDGL